MNESTKNTNEQIPWRETGRYPMLFFLDARALYPFIVFFVHMSKWTFYVALGGVAVFWMLNMTGISPPAALRTVRTYLVGRYRPTIRRTSTLRRRMEIPLTYSRNTSSRLPTPLGDQ